MHNFFFRLVVFVTHNRHRRGEKVVFFGLEQAQFTYCLIITTSLQTVVVFNYLFTLSDGIMIHYEYFFCDSSGLERGFTRVSPSLRRTNFQSLYPLLSGKLCLTFSSLLFKVYLYNVLCFFSDDFSQTFCECRGKNLNIIDFRTFLFTLETVLIHTWRRSVVAHFLLLFKWFWVHWTCIQSAILLNCKMSRQREKKNHNNGEQNFKSILKLFHNEIRHFI